MAGAPHTHCQKGKRVFVRLKDGSTITDKYVERKGRLIHLENHKIESRDVKSLSIVRRSE